MIQEMRMLQDCNERHPDDVFKPSQKVLKEHPGVDLNCWFHFYQAYLMPEPSNFTEMFRSSEADFSGKSDAANQKQLHLPNGEVLTTRNEGDSPGASGAHWGNYAYDDTMCYQMGWMRGQRLDKHIQKLSNAEEWLKVVEDECRHVVDLVNESDRWMFDEDSKYMTVGYMADDNNRIRDASECLWEPLGTPCKRHYQAQPVQKATLLDYALHLYPKCLLGTAGHLTGNAAQMTWCFARSCVDENKMIKHGTDCGPLSEWEEKEKRKGERGGSTTTQSPTRPKGQRRHRRHAQ
jgi:hypothetical protein